MPALTTQGQARLRAVVPPGPRVPGGLQAECNETVRVGLRSWRRAGSAPARAARRSHRDRHHHRPPASLAFRFPAGRRAAAHPLQRRPRLRFPSRWRSAHADPAAAPRRTPRLTSTRNFGMPPSPAGRAAGCPLTGAEMQSPDGGLLNMDPPRLRSYRQKSPGCSPAARGSDPPAGPGLARHLADALHGHATADALTGFASRSPPPRSARPGNTTGRLGQDPRRSRYISMVPSQRG